MTIPRMNPARQILDEARALLQGQGIEATRQELVWMLEKATGLPQATLLFSEVDAEANAVFDRFVARRMAREPVQYILGEADFYGRTFAVNPSVLIPRPETEGLVERALLHIPRIPGGAQILDVGTGSGCIAVTIAALRPDVRVTAIDISPEALTTARLNARTHSVDVRFVLGDFLSQDPLPDGPYDLIISNPPYVSLEEKDQLSVEVREHEPAQALFAGADDLIFYRRLAQISPRILKPGSWLVVETHADAAGRVLDLLDKAAFMELRIDPDLAGLSRYVTGHT